MVPRPIQEGLYPVSSALQDLQKSALGSLVLAHDLGLYHYWRALDLDRRGMQEAASEAWRRAIANWALVLDDDDYWQEWAQARSGIYKTEIVDEDLKAAREQLRDRLDRDFSGHRPPAQLAAGGDPARDGDPLDVILDLEISGLRALRAAGSLPLGDNAKVACGPLMVQQLGLSSELGRFVVAVADVDNAPAEAFAQLMRLLGEDVSSLQGEQQTRTRLLRYFSQLGVPAVYLDRSQPKAALAALTGRCGHPSAVQAQRSRRSSLAPGALPAVCQMSCPRFAECNPAHAALKDGAALLAGDSIRMAVDAHLELAELAIATDLAEIQEAMAEWELALELSTEISERAKTRDTIVDTLVGRATALKGSGRLDDAIDLLEATQEAYADGELTGKLAQLLTDRGVRAGNAEQWEESVANLRRAYEINPHVPRTRDNFVTALRGLASSLLSERPEAAEAPLREAVRVLEAEMSSEGSDPRLRDTLREVRGELAMSGFARMLGTPGADSGGGDEDQPDASGLAALAEALRSSGPREPRPAAPTRPAGESASSRFAGMMDALGGGSGEVDERPATTPKDTAAGDRKSEGVPGSGDGTSGSDRPAAPAQAGRSEAAGDRFSSMLSILQGGTGDTQATPSSEPPQDSVPAPPAAGQRHSTGEGSESDRVVSMMEAFGSKRSGSSVPATPAPRPSSPVGIPRGTAPTSHRTAVRTLPSTETKPATRNRGCLIPMLLSIALVGISLGTDLLGSGPDGGLGVWQIIGAAVGFAVFLASYQAFRTGV